MSFNDVDMASLSRDFFDNNVPFAVDSLKLLLSIQHWLGYPGAPRYKVAGHSRMATCLTTRSEAELFGVSMPRFCVRLYLDGNRQETFLNLRRSHLLVHNIEQSRALTFSRAKGAAAIEHAHISRAKNNLRNPGLIADSVLAVTKKFSDSYHVVSTTLRAAYGECSSPREDRSFAATPYVQHFWATSLCGHAVIFMASMLMKKHVKSIHAPSEIAALLRDSSKDEILITGLSPRHVEKYFKHKDVLLSAYNQLTPSFSQYEKQFPGYDWNMIRQKCFQNALRSYLLSKMPVIKLVDYNRLNGDGPDIADPKGSIYGSNPTLAIKTEHASAPFYPENHMVLLVGCRKKKASPKKGDFLLHDPSWHPYLSATTEQLMFASSYRTVAPATFDDRPQIVYDNGHPVVTPLQYQPITPRAVRMPLHTWLSYSSSHFQAGLHPKPRLGLFELTCSFYETEHTTKIYNACRPAREDYLAGEFRLVQFEDIENAFASSEWLGEGCKGPIQKGLRATLGKIISKIGTREHALGHWFWVQRFKESLWIWDAEREPHDAQGAQDFLVAVGNSKRHAVSFKNMPKGGNENREAHCSVLNHQAHHNPATTSKKPEISLITSFCHKGVLEALKVWPDEVRYAEVYAFMRGDIDTLLDPLQGNAVSRDPNENVMTVMARIFTQAPEQIEVIASKLGKAFSNRPIPIKIRSFATFLPELVHSDVAIRETAVAAFRFLCRLAKLLQEDKCGAHKVHHIEMVGGSILDGVIPATYRGKRSMIVKRRPIATHQQNRLLEVLRLLTPDLIAADLSVAIEAEPGPLFACGTSEGVCALASNIAHCVADGSLPNNRIGLNCDLGHYLLMHWVPPSVTMPGYGPNISCSCCKMLVPVIGAHISDHMAAHAADCVIGTIHKRDVFVEWVRHLSSSRNHKLDFLTIEMECVKDQRILQSAVDAVRRI